LERSEPSALSVKSVVTLNYKLKRSEPSTIDYLSAFLSFAKIAVNSLLIFNSKFKIQNSKFKIQNSKFIIQNS